MLPDRERRRVELICPRLVGIVIGLAAYVMERWLRSIARWWRAGWRQVEAEEELTIRLYGGPGAMARDLLRFWVVEARRDIGCWRAARPGATLRYEPAVSAWVTDLTVAYPASLVREFGLESPTLDPEIRMPVPYPGGFPFEIPVGGSLRIVIPEVLIFTGLDLAEIEWAETGPGELELDQRASADEAAARTAALLELARAGDAAGFRDLAFAYGIGIVDGQADAEAAEVFWQETRRRVLAEPRG